MKLSQLRIIESMSRHNLNVSETADALFTSQPAVSKQIKAFEVELGIDIFVRSGKQMVDFSEAGHTMLPVIREILQKVDRVKSIANEHSNPHLGVLRLGTTHTQARYVLPPIIRQFSELYPRVELNIHQGTPNQLADLLYAGTVDLVIATEAYEYFEEAISLPCHTWERAILVPKNHPLHNLHRLDGLSLEALVQYPLITYVFAFEGDSLLRKKFESAGLDIKVALTAVDTDIIKTYVEMGLGVGIIAEMAFDEPRDDAFALLEVPGLLPSSVTALCLRKHFSMREFHYAFTQLFSQQLSRERFDALVAMDPSQRQKALPIEALPRY